MLLFVILKYLYNKEYNHHAMTVSKEYIPLQLGEKLLWEKGKPNQ